MVKCQADILQQSFVVAESLKCGASVHVAAVAPEVTLSCAGSVDAAWS